MGYLKSSVDSLLDLYPGKHLSDKLQRDDCEKYAGTVTTPGSSYLACDGWIYTLYRVEPDYS